MGRAVARYSLTRLSKQQPKQTFVARRRSIQNKLTEPGQVHAERGFRFLKDPMFLANTLYLKKAERIMALLMVMTLCLLVYAALEHRIRKALNESGKSVPDQKGKATKAPTAKWVFELFLDVHLLLITQGTLQVLSMNLEDEVKTLLYLLGPHYTTAYS